MRVALVHLGHSTPLVVSIILERSAVLAIFAMVLNSPLTGSHFRLNLWPTRGFVWGETEGAANQLFYTICRSSSLHGHRTRSAIATERNRAGAESASASHHPGTAPASTGDPCLLHPAPLPLVDAMRGQRPDRAP